MRLKPLVLFLLLSLPVALSISFAAVAQTRPATSATSHTWGETLIRTTWKHLDRAFMQARVIDLDQTYDDHTLLTPERMRLRQLLERLMSVKERVPLSSLEFRSGSDPVFVLKPGEPPRTAVTGTAPDSPIIFNLDVINRVDNFTVKDAVSLLIHELGHKIEKGTQFQIDSFATEFSKSSEFSQHVLPIPGQDAHLIAVNWPAQDNRMPMSADLANLDPLYLEKPTLALVEKSRVTDLTEKIFPFSVGQDIPGEPLSRYVTYGQTVQALFDQRSADPTRLRFAVNSNAYRKPVNIQNSPDGYVSSTSSGSALATETSFELDRNLKLISPAATKVLRRAEVLLEDGIRFSGKLEKDGAGNLKITGAVELDVRVNQGYALYEGFGNVEFFLRVDGEEVSLKPTREWYAQNQKTYSQTVQNGYIVAQKLEMEFKVPALTLRSAKSVEFVGMNLLIRNFEMKNQNLEGLFFLPFRAKSESFMGSLKSSCQRVFAD